MFQGPTDESSICGAFARTGSCRRRPCRDAHPPEPFPQEVERDVDAIVAAPNAKARVVDMTMPVKTMKTSVMLELCPAFKRF
jgi:hypothetical protein